MVTIRRAERKRAKLRLAICGPSGSGKTFSSLLIGQGLGKKIGLIDTERGSGELYSHKFVYDVCAIEPPYTPAKYIDVIKTFEREGYDVLIIDSLSHAWSGEGGVLDIHGKASVGKNSFAAWRDVTPMHNRLVDTILGCNMHVIVTMRSKVEYIVETDEKGKQVPRTVGMAPIQREGMAYEFTTVLDMSVERHIATSSKDRTGLFDGQQVIPEVSTGTMLLEWLNAGVEETPRTQQTESQNVAADKPADPVSDVPTVETLFDYARIKGVAKPDWDKLREKAGITKDKSTHTPVSVMALKELLEAFAEPKQ